jgi:hypothetical protein
MEPWEIHSAIVHFPIALLIAPASLWICTLGPAVVDPTEARKVSGDRPQLSRG